ncbi:MAG: alpha/beta hydrolase, partial [Acidimicrobiales bacterium]
MRIQGEGVDLEARWDSPENATAAVVLCHPHPQHGGTMRAPLMHKVMKALTGNGLAVLRFNFRGVGTSKGEWSGGVGEMDDVAAAVAEARGGYDSVAVAGWSFGAATSLRWQARDGDGSTY